MNFELEIILFSRPLKSLRLQLIVAVEPIEIPRLEELYKRGLQNGVKDMKMIDGSQIKEIEPNCVVSVDKESYLIHHSSI